TGCRRAVRPTGSMRWYGPSPRWRSAIAPARACAGCDVFNEDIAMLDRLKSLFVAPQARPSEAKASRTAQVLAFERGGRPRWTPRDYAALAREGYLSNAIVHRAVRLIAENAASCVFLVYEGAREHEAHPLLALLARP